MPGEEKATAPHSSVLAWRIPGMGEPGGLPSMGLHRVGHDWSDLAVAAAVPGFSGGSAVKHPSANTGDSSSIPGLRRSPGGGNGNSLHSSCLENPMDRGAWQATIYGVSKSRTRLSNRVHMHAIHSACHRSLLDTGVWTSGLNPSSTERQRWIGSLGNSWLGSGL